MNILFDLDGTLTDPFEGITKCIAYALSGLGREAVAQKELAWCIGPPLKNSFATLLQVDAGDELAEQALTLYRQRFTSVGLYENRLFAPIPSILEELVRRGHLLYVATAKPTVYAERIIDHFALSRYFQVVYGSELDGRFTDKTSLIQHIISRENIDRRSTCMIGDRKHDITGAKNNSLRAVGVCWGYGSQEELEEAGADLCIDDPDELLPLFP